MNGMNLCIWKEIAICVIKITLQSSSVEVGIYFSHGIFDMAHREYQFALLSS